MDETEKVKGIHCFCENPCPRKDWSGVEFCFDCGKIVWKKYKMDESDEVKERMILHAQGEIQGEIPICPYCEHRLNDYEYNFTNMTEETRCHHCDKEIVIEKIEIVKFSTWKKDIFYKLRR